MDQSTRRNVLDRDDYRCWDCDTPVGPQHNPHLATANVHHLTPQAEDGTDDAENLVTLCLDCHADRHGVEQPDEVSCPSSTVPTARYIEAVHDHEPAATSEIADAVGVTRQGADYRLRSLEEDGRVTSTMVGNSLAWMTAD
jgi:hypothetical protein